ncbi:MAG: sulfatase-like hydrolase/transferase, partial [Verrucomicrobiae bacterium]|nr:sulfatase-like hydrolase/transferase [Verrucomicrobiae bacterium]
IFSPAHPVRGHQAVLCQVPHRQDHVAGLPADHQSSAPAPAFGSHKKEHDKLTDPLRREALQAYYASTTFMDAQIGRVLAALKESGQEENTIVVLWSDHGYHLGEHDFWAKVSLRDESAMVPLIIKVPGRKPAVCRSLVELLDLYPTTARLCGLDVPARLQGKDISRMFDDPMHSVRDSGFSVAPSSKGFLLREDKWAYIQYAEDASRGIELYDMAADPKQYTNLAGKPEFAPVVESFKAKLAAKLRAARDNDLTGK